MHPSQRGQSNISARPSFSDSLISHCHTSDNSTLGARAAYALTSTLANPYGQTNVPSYSYINQNYAQAYFNQMLQQQQQQQRGPRTTEEGYTFSSTYDPSSFITPSYSGIQSNQFYFPPSRNNGQNLSSSHAPIHTHANYQRHYPSHSSHRRPPASGDIKCTYPSCSFSGSKHTVEIHRMDRHLIYPPGWKKRTDDWDADPSLKGKPIPILGTGLVLDTPESIDAWIAERKKRWPSKRNIEEKKKREQEAEQRGEINPSELSRSTAKGMKRRRLGNNEERNHSHLQNYRHSLPSSNSQKHKRARTVRDLDDDSNKPRCLENSPVKNSPTAPNSDNPTNPVSDTHVNLLPRSKSGIMPSLTSPYNYDSDDQSSSDVDPVRDAIPSKNQKPVGEEEECSSVKVQCVSGQPTLQEHQLSPFQHVQAGERVTQKKKLVPHPRKQPRNPFALRTHLLRSLLLPEIKNTVSNLSQAIHFLTENDFFVGVELKPGDADTQLIQVLENREG